MTPVLGMVATWPAARLARWIEKETSFVDGGQTFVWVKKTTPLNVPTLAEQPAGNAEGALQNAAAVDGRFVPAVVIVPPMLQSQFEAVGRQHAPLLLAGHIVVEQMYGFVAVLPAP